MSEWNLKTRVLCWRLFFTVIFLITLLPVMHTPGLFWIPVLTLIFLYYWDFYENTVWPMVLRWDEKNAMQTDEILYQRAVRQKQREIAAKSRLPDDGTESRKNSWNF